MKLFPSEDDIPGRVYTKTRTHNVDGAKDISLGTFFTNTPAYRNDDDESVQSNIDINRIVSNDYLIRGDAKLIYNFVLDLPSRSNRQIIDYR